MQSDPVLKALVEAAPADWLPLLGLPRRRVSIEDADVSLTMSGATDKVLRVHDHPEYLVHLEFQSGHDSAGLPRRLKMYNGVLEYRHDRLVVSAAVILHPGADSPRLTGVVERGLPGQAPISYLRYQVVRVWQLPVDRLLEGGVGTLPLAPISDVSAARLPEVMRRMQERLHGRHQRWLQEVWGATFVLVGLRYSKEIARRLFREVLHMKESVTYQAIIEEGRTEGRVEGRAEEGRRLLLRLGQKRFGRPDPSVQAAIEGLTDVERIEGLVERLDEVGSWQELFRLAKPRRRNGRKPAT